MTYYGCDPDPDPDDDDLARDCECDAPDPSNDEPWVPVVCANCGGLL